MPEEDDLHLAAISVAFDFSRDAPGAACSYCGCELVQPPENRVHGECCPFRTGLWTLNLEGFATVVCPGCGTETTPACGWCEHPFDDGDPYRLADRRTRLLIGAPADGAEGLAVCLSCADRQASALSDRLAP